MKKNYKSLIKKNSGQKKGLKEMMINDMSNRKVMIDHLIARLIKKDLINQINAIPLYKNKPKFS